MAETRTGVYGRRGNHQRGDRPSRAISDPDFTRVCHSKGQVTGSDVKKVSAFDPRSPKTQYGDTSTREILTAHSSRHYPPAGLEWEVHDVHIRSGKWIPPHPDPSRTTVQVRDGTGQSIVCVDKNGIWASSSTSILPKDCPNAVGGSNLGSVASRYIVQSISRRSPNAAQVAHNRGLCEDHHAIQRQQRQNRVEQIAHFWDKKSQISGLHYGPIQKDSGDPSQQDRGDGEPHRQDFHQGNSTAQSEDSRGKGLLLQHGNARNSSLHSTNGKAHGPTHSASQHRRVRLQVSATTAQHIHLHTQKGQTGSAGAQTATTTERGQTNDLAEQRATVRVIYRRSGSERTMGSSALHQKSSNPTSHGRKLWSQGHSTDSEPRTAGSSIHAAAYRAFQASHESPVQRRQPSSNLHAAEHEGQRNPTCGDTQGNPQAAPRKESFSRIRVRVYQSPSGRLPHQVPREETVLGEAQSTQTTPESHLQSVHPTANAERHPTPGQRAFHDRIYRLEEDHHSGIQRRREDPPITASIQGASVSREPSAGPWWHQYCEYLARLANQARQAEKQAKDVRPSLERESNVADTLIAWTRSYGTWNTARRTALRIQTFLDEEHISPEELILEQNKFVPKLVVHFLTSNFSADIQHITNTLQKAQLVRDWEFKWTHRAKYLIEAGQKFHEYFVKQRQRRDPVDLGMMSSLLKEKPEIWNRLPHELQINRNVILAAFTLGFRHLLRAGEIKHVKRKSIRIEEKNPSYLDSSPSHPNPASTIRVARMELFRTKTEPYAEIYLPMDDYEVIRRGFKNKLPGRTTTISAYLHYWGMNRSKKWILKRVDAHAITTWLQKIYSSLDGYTPEMVKNVKSHSLRIGGANQMLLEGYSLEMISVKGRWHSPAIFRYLRQMIVVMHQAKSIEQGHQHPSISGAPMGTVLPLKASTK